MGKTSVTSFPFVPGSWFFLYEAHWKTQPDLKILNSLSWSSGHAEQLLFSCLCWKVAVYSWKCQWFFFYISSTRSTDIRVSRAGSQLKIQLPGTNGKEVMDVFPIFRRWNRANLGRSCISTYYVINLSMCNGYFFNMCVLVLNVCNFFSFLLLYILIFNNWLCFTC